MKAKFNAKYVVFSVVAIMMTYVIFHNERFVVEPDNPVWQHYEPFKWSLLVHGIAGLPVMLFPPFLFSERLRKRFTKLHRIGGRLYVLGVLIVAPFGAYIQYVEERQGFPRSFTVLAVIDALMFMGTTLMAFVFAYKRKLTQHRQWMIRSYAVALVFLEVRFILGVTGLDKMGVEMVQAVIWSCLALSLLLADLANNWLEIRALVAAPTKSPAPAKREVPSGAVEPA